MQRIDSLKGTLQEALLPELRAIQTERAWIKTALSEVSNRRIEDIQRQLVDQSRRIDEANKRIEQTNQRISETNRSIASLYEVIVRRDEHPLVLERVGRLERALKELRQRVAA
jgi:peptidoglycan hydrolase CwlO-like protein